MSGVLPPGLYIPELYITSTSASCMASSCQTITGTPTTPGTYKFKLAVVSGSQVASREFEIIVQSTTPTPTPLTITTTSLPSATVGQFYTATVNATGGSDSYSWRINGSLPPGLSLITATCIMSPCQTPVTISGIPTTPTTLPGVAYKFSLTVVSGSQVASREFEIAVKSTASPTAPLIFGVSSVPNGVVGVQYFLPLRASGGSMDYEWRITKGSLPPGLTLKVEPPECFTCPRQATITGVPTTVGIYDFVVTVTSGSESASADLIIIIKATTANQLPIGYLDRADCEIIGGWAYDPDIPTAQIMVHIYDGGAGVGKFLGAFETTGLREDVNAAYNIKGNHGFTLSTLPHFPSLGDGNKHTIYAYAIDDAGEKNPELINSPRSLLCPPPAPVGSGANLKQMANILDALSGALLKLQGLVR